MCGIVGIYSHEPVAAELHDALIHLQHRGQDAAGILTSDDKFYYHHGMGLVREIFTENKINQLKGSIGIAHVRYPTAGGYNESDTQPVWLGNPRGIALAHNGNLTNHVQLKHELCQKQFRHMHSTIDSEVLLLLLSDQLSENTLPDEDAAFFNLLKNAMKTIFEKAKGAYSVVSLILGKGLIAFRDPFGIRPLVLGVRHHANGTADYIFASENTAFYALGFEYLDDLKPGEIAYVSLSGKLHRAVISFKALKPCVFEYVYFARPDATLNQVSVYRSRLRMGQNLAKKWRAVHPDILPDVVIPAPFTANTAALSFAHELGVRYSEGLYKNPFIGRTFIMPNQQKRARGVRYKLTPQRTEIENKNVLILDDSIVRGTTSHEIVKMIKEYGAKAIYFVSTAPEIKFPCFYGIDMPSSHELIAARETTENIRAYLGVDYLLYQTRDDLIEAVTRRGEHHITRPCMACMDGCYVADDLTEQDKNELTTLRAAERV